jgi:hypothetical protein
MLLVSIGRPATRCRLSAFRPRAQSVAPCNSGSLLCQRFISSSTRSDGKDIQRSAGRPRMVDGVGHP